MLLPGTEGRTFVTAELVSMPGTTFRPLNYVEYRIHDAETGERLITGEAWENMQAAMLIEMACMHNNFIYLSAAQWETILRQSITPWRYAVGDTITLPGKPELTGKPLTASNEVGLLEVVKGGYSSLHLYDPLSLTPEDLMPIVVLAGLPRPTEPISYADAIDRFGSLLHDAAETGTEWVGKPRKPEKAPIPRLAELFPQPARE